MSNTLKNILLICGGGGTEHEISLISANFIKEQVKLADPNFKVHYVEICKDGNRRTEDGKLCELRRAGELVIYTDETKTTSETIYLHFAIPCIHGYPGETGDIQSVFEMMGLPYLGVNSEGSKICFNKVTTKLWLRELGINITPYIFLNNDSAENLTKVKTFFNEHKDIFIKASSQGSSVGTYHVTKESDLEKYVKEAFKLSPFVLIEKTIKARELEIATYEYEGNLRVTVPGEIICPDGFYTYEEKYNSKSQTTTDVVAKNVPKEVVEKMREMARVAFTGLKLSHLSRIDFFYDPKNHDVMINEINTFPGHTSISMFPMMLKNHGDNYPQFIKSIILKEARS